LSAKSASTGQPEPPQLPLLKRPLLDEPLSDLDATLREQMRFESKTVQRRVKITHSRPGKGSRELRPHRSHANGDLLGSGPGPAADKRIDAESRNARNELDNLREGHEGYGMARAASTVWSAAFAIRSILRH
jgi:hypothetical protein